MKLNSITPKTLGLYIGVAALALAVGYFYVLAMGSGYRFVLVINAGVIFFALAAIFLREIRPFLFVLLLISIPMGFGRHIIFEPIQTESVPFAIGININSTDILMFMLYSVWMIDRSGRIAEKTKLTLGNPIGSLLLLWIGFMFVVSLGVSTMPNHSLYQVYATFKGFFIFFLIANSVQTERDLKITYYALVATTLNQAIYLILQWITKTTFTTHGEVATAFVEREGFRSRGFYGAPDTHAALMMLVFECILVYFLITKNRDSKFWALLSMILIIVGTICTKARIGLGVCVLASMIVIAVVYMRGYMSAKRVTFVIIEAMFALLLISPVVAQRFITGGYMEDRLPLMYTALVVVFDHFFLGIGPNNYHARLFEFVPPELRNEWAYTVHNEYLLQAAETGMIGASLYYGSVVVAIMNFWKLTRSRNQWIVVLSVGFFAALVGSLVHRFISIYFLQPIYFMQCFILGLSVALLRVEKTIGSGIEPKPAKQKRSFASGPYDFTPPQGQPVTTKSY
jgi:O-antigen ligase